MSPPQIIALVMPHTILHDTSHMITHKAHPTHETWPILHKHTYTPDSPSPRNLPPQVTGSRLQSTPPSFLHPKPLAVHNQDQDGGDGGYKL